MSASDDYPEVATLTDRPAWDDDLLPGQAAAALDEIDRLRARTERLTAAILDIDAHATGFGEDADGFVAGGYLISVGCLHRALGVVGHTSRKCRHCQPTAHDCEGKQ